MNAELEVIARRGKVALLGNIHPGTIWRVNGADGNDTGDNRGSYWGWALKTLTEAISRAATYDRILVAPGDYALFSIPRAKTGLRIVGAGNSQTVFIGTAGGAEAIVNDADKVTFENLWLENTTVGLLNRGQNVRFLGGMIQNVTTALKLSLGTAAQQAAGTYGNGGDFKMIHTEIGWVTNAVELVAVAGLPVTQARFYKAFLHNMTAKGFTSSGGDVDNRFRDLWIEECKFGRNEAGVDPTTGYLDLAPDNANTGHVMRNCFPVAKASDKIAVSTNLIKSGNDYTDGHD